MGGERAQDRQEDSRPQEGPPEGGIGADGAQGSVWIPACLWEVAARGPGAPVLLPARAHCPSLKPGGGMLIRSSKDRAGRRRVPSGVDTAQARPRPRWVRGRCPGTTLRSPPWEGLRWEGALPFPGRCPQTTRALSLAPGLPGPDPDRGSLHLPYQGAAWPGHHLLWPDPSSTPPPPGAPRFPAACGWPWAPPGLVPDADPASQGGLSPASVSTPPGSPWPPGVLVGSVPTRAGRGAGGCFRPALPEIGRAHV